MDLTEPIHRKIIGICFVVFSALGLLGLLFYSYFMDFIIDLAVMDDDFTPELMWVFDFIEKFVWAIAIIFLVPRFFLGFGLINQRKWAETPSMIYAVIGLINIPLGTLLGIYTLMVLTAKPKTTEGFEKRDH